jgi:hypothetical protein
VQRVSLEHQHPRNIHETSTKAPFPSMKGPPVAGTYYHRYSLQFFDGFGSFFAVTHSNSRYIRQRVLRQLVCRHGPLPRLMECFVATSEGSQAEFHCHRSQMFHTSRAKVPYSAGWVAKVVSRYGVSQKALSPAFPLHLVFFIGRFSPPGPCAVL